MPHFARTIQRSLRSTVTATHKSRLQESRLNFCTVHTREKSHLRIAFLTKLQSIFLKQSPNALSTSCPALGHNRYLTTSTKHGRQRGFVPRKAALKLTENARKFCKLLLKNSPDPENIIGIMLKYQPASGEMRMVFSLGFAKQGDVGPDDEGVSLEVLEDGSPKPPSESDLDNLPKLYIHHSGFMKLLGGTMDIEIEKDGSFHPTFKDREGNDLDPNN